MYQVNDSLVVDRLGSCVIKEVVSQKRILVDFLDYNQTKWCSAHDLRRGYVRIEKPTVHGFGISDVYGVKGNPVYERWRVMILRCYGANKDVNHPWYKDVRVCNDWARFSNFMNWWGDKPLLGHELDKDLMGSGLLYSPENCCVIPQRLNTILSKQSDRPLGVYYETARSKWCTTTEKFKRFTNQEDAHFEWLRYTINVLESFSLPNPEALALNSVVSKLQENLKTRTPVLKIINKGD